MWKFPSISANCYEKVKTETSAMQEKMVQELGINPVEKEVVIVYQGEKQEHGDEFFQVSFIFS